MGGECEPTKNIKQSTSLCFENIRRVYGHGRKISHRAVSPQRFFCVKINDLETIPTSGGLKKHYLQ